MESQGKDGGWRRVGILGLDDLPASLSDNAAGRRDLVVFSCQGDHSVVALSVGGVDISYGVVREMACPGLVLLARLGPGERYERAVLPDGHLTRTPITVRWTHLSGS